MNNSFTLGRYFPTDSPMHKMDPRAKIAAMLAVLIAIFFPAGWWGYLILFIAACAAILLSHLKFSLVWKSMRPMLTMMVILFIINVFAVHTGSVLLTIGKLSVYSDGVFQTLYIVVRLLLMVMITTCLTSTTKPLEMTLGIEDLLRPLQKIGVPAHEIAMLISIALRFIPDLIEETQRIMKAQESRGVDFQEGKLKEKVAGILSLIVPLFVSSFSRAEELADAMEARGYAPGLPRTRYKVLKMKGQDYALLICANRLLVLMIYLAYWA